LITATGSYATPPGRIAATTINAIFRLLGLQPSDLRQDRNIVAITYAGIRALSWLGAVAAIAGYRAVGGGTLTFGAAISLIMATFADSGTMTADFTRWSKNGRQAVLAAATAFPVGSVIAQLTGGVVVTAGAIDDPAIDGGIFLPRLTHGQGAWLGALAAIFVLINLGSVAATASTTARSSRCSASGASLSTGSGCSACSCRRWAGC
jgi:hypothetical protein